MVDKVDTQRRREILQAAARLFRNQGYERTSVRQIAEALTMTSGSLFYHFAAKEEMLVAVMEEGISDVFAAVEASFQAEGPMPEKLLAMVRSHVAALLGPNLDALMVVFYEWRSLSGPAVHRVLTCRNRYEDLWDAALAAAAVEGWVHRDTILVRQTTLGALNWTGHWYRPERRLDIDGLSLRMFELLFPRLFERLGAQLPAGAGEALATPVPTAAGTATA